MDPQIVEYRVASVTHKIRRKKSLASPLRGIIYAGDVFGVGEVVGYDECSAGWAAVQGGYVCLVKTKVVSSNPIPLPTFLEFLPPLPAEELQSNESHSWMFTATESEYFMPTIHGKRDDEHEGRLWKSIESYEQEDSAKWRLSENRDYRFVAAHETSRGWVLERPNGAIAPLDEVYVYGATRFAGRDMSQHPLLADTLPGWVIARQGVSIYWEPSLEAEKLIHLDYRRSIDIQLSEKDDWWAIPMGDFVGYVPKASIRVWQAKDTPDIIATDSIWIDADLETQMLAMYQGEEMIFLTLMSSAKEGHVTPVGIYQIYDKTTGWDLGSKDGAEDAYFMERVPFVMHYAPRYAIHSAFWHDDFGEPASHGCLNLSPNDAHFVFDKVAPELPDGWRFVKHSKQFGGSVIRIRKGNQKVSDKRIKP